MYNREGFSSGYRATVILKCYLFQHSFQQDDVMLVVFHLKSV